MDYEIIGEVMPVVQLTMEAGESLQCQVGAMKWMDPSIDMATSASGGVGGFIKRKVTGVSGFLNTYTARRSGARIALGHTYPGKIMAIRVDEQPLVCQKRTFLASEPSVNFNIKFHEKLGVGFFGGEGFIMQKLEGSGLAFLEIDGEMVEHTLGPGESLKTETGAVAIFEDSVEMNIEMVKGIKNMIFGGEGLFLTTLTGPGRIWLQTMSIQSLAAELSPYLQLGRK